MKIIHLAISTLALTATSLLGCDADDELAGDRLADVDADADADAYLIEPPEDADAAPPHTAADALTTQDAVATGAPNYYEPVGTHDQANCNVIEGWVKDGDTTLPTWASIRTAPYPQGSDITIVYADLVRNDLHWADKAHGFSIPTPASLKDGFPHTIYIHGINVDVNGDWDTSANSPLLSGTGKTICCGECDPPGPDDPNPWEY